MSQQNNNPVSSFAGEGRKRKLRVLTFYPGGPRQKGLAASAFLAFYLLYAASPEFTCLPSSPLKVRVTYDYHPFERERGAMCIYSRTEGMNQD